jgi:sulfite exporter TauE/SafE
MEAALASALGSAFLAGVLGSVHCAAMCAAPMGAALGAAPPDTHDLATPLRGSVIRLTLVSDAMPHRALGTQAGRIVSYMLGGALAGTAGASAAYLPGASAALLQGALALAAQLVLLLTGVYLLGHTVALGWLERLAQPVWRHVKPAALSLLPIQSTRGAFAFGALWGWIPCGLSWAMLAVALTTGSAWAGALILGAFGIGTLPAMWVASSGVATLLGAGRRAQWRTLAGVLVIAMAVVGLIRIATTDQRAADFLKTCAPLFGAIS